MVHYIDYWREWLGKRWKSPIRVIIHQCWEDGNHVENSLHYTGKAVDLRLEEEKEDGWRIIDVIDQWMLAEMVDLFRGIGLYPFWHNPGLHLDIRKIPARWVKWSGTGYRELNAKIIKVICDIY